MMQNTHLESQQITRSGFDKQPVPSSVAMCRIEVIELYTKNTTFSSDFESVSCLYLMICIHLRYFEAWII